MRKPTRLTMMVSAPIQKEEIKSTKDYLEPIGDKNPHTPEMTILKKSEINLPLPKEEPQEKNTEQKKEISKIESIKKLALNRKQTPPLMSLSCSPVSAQEIKPLSKYKEPQKQAAKETPEMATLKKLPKRRKKKRLFIVKQTSSKPHRKTPRQKQQPVSPSKRIQAL